MQRDVEQRINELLQECEDWLAGRRSWWNKYAPLADPNDSESSARLWGLCAIEDTQEVVKRAALISALAAADGGAPVMPENQESW